MKTVLEYLKECLDMAQHNQLCYSATYAMDRPKVGFEREYAEAVRDGQIVDELIAMVKEKETPAKQTPLCEYVISRKDFQKLQNILRELDDYIMANTKSVPLSESVKKKLSQTGVPKQLIVDQGHIVNEHMNEKGLI